MEALDAFRGITIAGMILVNNPGTWSAAHPPLRHADWHGWTPTDLIFPFFLFIVGVSIALALGRRAEEGGARRDLFRKIARRTIIIFALGLFLNAFPDFNPSTLRIPGVLQRIALCYFVASVIFVTTGVRRQTLIAVALLVVYWLLMLTTPVPGYGVGDLSVDGNLAAFIDRSLLAGHTYRPNYDPEGILSTLPAISTTLFGVLTGRWLRTPREPLDKVSGMFVTGAALVVLGWAWYPWFPINKPLWTSSYVLFTAGMALQLFAACYWLIDIKGYRRWATPFRIFGLNALAVYFLSSLVADITSTVWTVAGPGGARVPVKTWFYERAFASWASPPNASLLFAIFYVLVWLGLMTILYRRKIFIKV